MNKKMLSIALSCLIVSSFCCDSFIYADSWLAPVKRSAATALSWTWRRLCSRYGMLAVGALATWGVYRFYSRTSWVSKADLSGIVSGNDDQNNLFFLHKTSTNPQLIRLSRIQAELEKEDKNPLDITVTDSKKVMVRNNVVVEKSVDEKKTTTLTFFHLEDGGKQKAVHTLLPPEKIANRGESAVLNGIGNSLTISPNGQYAAYIKDSGDAGWQEDKHVMVLDLRSKEDNQQQNSPMVLDSYEVAIDPKLFGQSKCSLCNIAFTADSEYLIINGCDENKVKMQWACRLAAISEKKSDRQTKVELVQPVLSETNKALSEENLSLIKVNLLNMPVSTEKDNESTIIKIDLLDKKLSDLLTDIKAQKTQVKTLLAQKIEKFFPGQFLLPRCSVAATVSYEAEKYHHIVYLPVPLTLQERMKSVDEMILAVAQQKGEAKNYTLLTYKKRNNKIVFRKFDHTWNEVDLQGNQKRGDVELGCPDVLAACLNKITGKPLLKSVCDEIRRLIRVNSEGTLLVDKKNASFDIVFAAKKAQSEELPKWPVHDIKESKIFLYDGGLVRAKITPKNGAAKDWFGKFNVL